MSQYHQEPSEDPLPGNISAAAQMPAALSPVTLCARGAAKLSHPGTDTCAFPLLLPEYVMTLFPVGISSPSL